MKSLNQFSPFVKGQAERVRRLAERCPEDNPNRKKNLQLISQTFSELAERLENLPPDTEEVTAKADALQITPKDVANLPQELLDQLSLSQGDWQDFDILKLFEDAGGVLSIDHVLIRLYQNTGEIPDRTKINSRLYRMTTKNLLYPVPGRKGVYSTTPVQTLNKEDASEEASDG